MTDPSRTRYCSYCLTTFIGELQRCPNLGCRKPRPPASWGILLEPGDTLDRHYQIHKRLAIGGAGVTYLAREVDAAGDEVGPKLAIKVLYAQRDQGGFLRRLSNEAQILQELDHQGIVQLMGFVHRRGHSPYLITRFEEGGSLLDHLRQLGRALSLKETAAVGIQLVDALVVAHARGVVHRDLKPENILLKRIPADGEYPLICLTDFGIAKVFGGVGGNLTQVGTFVGTPQYAAPEQFQGSEPTDATDTYAMGAVLYFCLTLNPLVPFADQLDPSDTLELLQEKLPPWVQLPDANPDNVAALNAALAASMAFDPSDRSSLSRVRELLLAVIHDQPVAVTSLTSGPSISSADVGESAWQEDTFAGILSKDQTSAYPEHAPTTWDEPESKLIKEVPLSPAVPGAEQTDAPTVRVRVSQHDDLAAAAVAAAAAAAAPPEPPASPSVPSDAPPASPSVPSDALQPADPPTPPEPPPFSPEPRGAAKPLAGALPPLSPEVGVALGAAAGLAALGAAAARRFADQRAEPASMPRVDTELVPDPPAPFTPPSEPPPSEPPPSEPPPRKLPIQTISPLSPAEATQQRPPTSPPPAEAPSAPPLAEPPSDPPRQDPGMSDPLAPLIEPAPDSEPALRRSNPAKTFAKAALALFALGSMALALVLIGLVYVMKTVEIGDLGERIPRPTPTQPAPGADALRLDPSDSAHKADYVIIQMSLERQLDAVAACSMAVEGGAFEVELVVEPGGAVSYAGVSGIANGADCVTDALEAMTLDRRGDQQVLFTRRFEIE